VLALAGVLALASGAAGTAASQPTIPAGPAERGQYAEVNGVRLFYHVKGRGAPLYVLPGGPGVAHDYVHAAVDSLAEVASLVFLDPRGAGRSSRGKKPKDDTLDRMADDLDALRKKLGHERIGILGHAFGGMLALTYAVRHPDRVDRLVLVSAAASGEELARRLSEVRAAVPDSQVGQEMWGFDGGFAAAGNLAKYDVRKRLSRIRCPTLILAGREELATPAMAEVLRKGILDSRVKVFERAAGFPRPEEREAFLRAVREFLAMPPAAE
jgi:proline iminopeptidase